MDVELARADQEVVDHGVEEAVVLHVVHVAVDVVVLPPRADRQEVRVRTPVHRSTLKCSGRGAFPRLSACTTYGGVTYGAVGWGIRRRRRSGDRQAGDEPAARAG